MTEVKKIWAKCPECGGNILPIIYGMPMPGTENAEAILGGCILEPDSPYAACEECGTPSTKLPRKHKTIISVQVLSSAGNRMESTETIDLELASTDLVADMALGLLDARYELVSRGWTPEEVNSYCEENDGLPMPIGAPVVTWLFFDAGNGQVLSIFRFYANGMWAMVEYLLPGQQKWGQLSSPKAFRDLVIANKRPDLQVWRLAETDDYNDDEPDLGQSWGSRVNRLFIAGLPITGEILEIEGTKLEKVKFWPDWFDPSNLF
jgi:hypothetical protein